MNEEETMHDPESNAPRTRKARTPKADRKVVICRVIDGKRKECGSFPEAVVGQPLERRLLPFLEERNYEAGDYRIEIRKPNGNFEQVFDFSIGEPESKREQIIDADPDGFDDESEEFSFPENTGQMNATEVENLLLKERLRRLEEDVARQKSGNQSETQALIAALEDSRREQRELLLMMLQQAQKPQADAGTLAMGMMQQSLEMVKSAKAMSEEIAPSGSGEGGSSFIADGTKLIDSLGRNAGTFLPILSGLIPKAAAQAERSEVPFTPGTNGDGGSGEFTELAGKIKNKEAAKNE